MASWNVALAVGSMKPRSADWWYFVIVGADVVRWVGAVYGGMRSVVGRTVWFS